MTGDGRATGLASLVARTFLPVHSGQTRSGCIISAPAIIFLGCVFEHPVRELHAIDDLGHQLMPVELSPVFLARTRIRAWVASLNNHGQRGQARPAALGLARSVANRGPPVPGFNRVRCSQMDPMFGRKRIVLCLKRRHLSAGRACGGCSGDRRRGSSRQWTRFRLSLRVCGARAARQSRRRQVVVPTRTPEVLAGSTRELSSRIAR